MRVFPKRLAPPPITDPQPAPAQTRTTKASRTVKKPVKRKNASQPAAKKRVPALPTVVAKSSPSDSMLLVGGLALVVLVLGDTILLAMSTRYLRV
jgi:hypothetical protein